MFRPWHPRQRTSNPRGSNQYVPPSRLPLHSEDAQPNEFVDRRHQPPAVNKVATQQMPAWRVGGARRDLQFVVWEPSGSMRPASGGPALPQADRSAGHRAWITPNFPPAPSGPPSDSPAPKRRKLRGSPVSTINCRPPTQRTASALPSPVSLVSSETLVGEPGVKRERSITPELSEEPQLITAGSKRYAPIPPDCQKSRPNYKAARSAWAKKEQEALKKLGLKVVRTFIREDGMVIDWETSESAAETATAIECALSLNHTAADSVNRTTPSLTHIPRDLNQPCAEREMSTPPLPAVEVALQIFSESSGRVIIEELTSVGQLSNPSSGLYQKGERQQPGYPLHADAVNAPIPASCLRGDPAWDSPPGLSPHHKTASYGPFRKSTTPSQLPQTQPPPSQRAVDTLQHILFLRRKIDRESPDLQNPSVVSPSSSPVRRLHPVPKTSPAGNRLPGSSADVVAAAINEGAQHRTRERSTPLYVYKKRPSSFVTSMRNARSTASQAGEGSHARRSQSSGRHSSPPIAILDPTKSAAESRTSSLDPYGEEYDELELSYPSSVATSPPGIRPDTLPLAIIPTTSPRPGESEEPVFQPPFSDSDIRLPPPDNDSAVMRSSVFHYFERYCRTFDVDRRALAEVYAPDAVFSCSSRNLHAQGRDNVLEALQALGHGILCSGHGVEYEVTYLSTGMGVLLVVLGTMSDARDANNGDVRYAMTFVLQPGGGSSSSDDLEMPAGELRPLVATVHQVVLEDGHAGSE